MAFTFRGFTEFTRSLVYAGHSVAQFSASAVSGGPVIQSFIQSIENLTQNVLSYSSKAFETATQNEINRLAAGGAISNSFSKKIDFDAGLELFDDIKKKLAVSAAALPGTTADYITVFRSLSDDMATALNSAKAGGPELKKLFRDKVPKAVETLVLQTKLYGQDIPVSSITRTYSKLLSTGKVNSREIFVQRNPVLRTGIEKWEKENSKKLPQLNVRERFEALNKIFADSISNQQMMGLTNSFQSKVEGFKSFVFDPDVGLFGFEREFKNASGETTTLFKTLADAIGPVIERFTILAQNIQNYADPAQLSANLFDKTIGVALEDFKYRLIDLNRTLQITEGDFQTKLRAALKVAFNFDYVTFDYSAAIDKFFAAIIKGIDTFGDDFKPTDEVGQSMTALLDGLFGVIGAIFRRLTKQAMTYPKETFQFIMLTNPALVLQGFIALATVSIALGQLFGFISGGLAAAGPGIKVFMAGISGTTVAVVGIVVAILAFIAGIIIFKDQLKAAGKNFTELGDNMIGPFKTAFQALGLALTLLGEAGQTLSDAWNKFASGDWRGALLGVFDGVGKAISGIIAGLGAGAAAVGGALVIAWEGIWPQLQKLGSFIVDGLVNLFTGKKDLNKLVDSVSNAPVIETKNGTKLDDALDAYKTWINRLYSIFGVAPAFSNASGNNLGNLLFAAQMEKRLMPPGANLVMANTSEAIIPAEKASQMLAPFRPAANVSTLLPASSSQINSSSSSSQVDNASSLLSSSAVTVNVYVTQSNSTGGDIAEEVRKALVSLLE